MAIPDYESLMLPTLMAFGDESETPLADIRSRVAKSQSLTPEEVRQRLPSGTQPVFTNRISWAVMYLERAGLLERIRRGVYRLTSEGALLQSRQPPHLDRSRLRQFPKYIEWENRARSPATDTESTRPPNTGRRPEETPEEALARAEQHLRRTLEADVLQRVLDAPPAFLERIVVDLLIAMGYGDGNADRGRVTGRSGDGGIDGTIREDALGLDEVYVQAKKFAKGNTVGEGNLRNFAGAIDAAGTTKGVFVTTSSFTPSAQSYVEKSPKRIILIDGQELAHLMVQHGIGVRRSVRYDNRIDEDYFDQETP